MTLLVFCVQDANDQKEELERVNKQLRLEMEQLVNQQDDVGKNVRLLKGRTFVISVCQTQVLSVSHDGSGP